MRPTLLHIILLLSLPAGIYAQLSRGGKPLVPGLQKSGIEWIQLEQVHAGELMLEDEWAAMTGKKSQRIAKEMPCELNPSNSGHWQTHPGGTRIWQLGIKGGGARALGLVFNRYFLQPGVRLFVFDPGREMILGAYTDLNNKASGMLPVSYLKGDELIVQLEVPEGLTDYGDLQIGAVRYAYRPVFEDKSHLDGSFGSSDTCNVDINCSMGQDWQLAKRSIVRLINGELCTGVLINNTSQDTLAYLLTAAHCIFNSSGYDKSNSTVFYFNYESPTCDGPDGIGYHSISGATLLATGDKGEDKEDADSLDFALLELSITPPDSLLPFYAGWNRGNSAPQHTTTLHHPTGDVMKISLDNDPPATDYHSEPYFEEFVYGSFWRIERWDVGTTQGGSSGGPLFNEDQQIVGTLTGGLATCENSVNDYFTRFDYDWDYYPDSLRQLKYWLDPGNTGAMSLEGFDPLVGIEEPGPAKANILLYPNPAQDQLMLEFNNRIPQAVEISVFNTAGTLLYRHNSQTPERTVIPVGHLLPGMYFLQVITEDSLISERFIIQR